MRHFFDAVPHTKPLFYAALAGTLIVGIGILAVLQILPTRMRRPLVALATFLGGLYYVAEFFIPTGWGVPRGVDGNFLSPYMDTVADVSNVIGALSIGLGVISLIGMHIHAVSRRRGSWGFSVALLVSFVAMAVFTLLNEYKPHSVVVPAFAGLPATTNHTVYDILFRGGLTSLDSAMFALIGFFIISASYRAFRIRSLEASLLMVSAVLVMLGQVTLGSSMTGWLPTHGFIADFRLENISENILVHLNAPAQRAVTFGLALGALATSLRLWLSLERGLYFDQE